MQAEVIAVPLAEKPDLWAMFQVYARELAPYANVTVMDGEVSYPLFDLYWREEQRKPFWAIANGERIGFALIRFAPEHDAMQMAEFFILPAHRRGGAGLSFARALIARHPGPWKIREIAANKAAVAFWRRVAEPFEYSEKAYADKGLDRIEQTVTVV